MHSIEQCPLRSTAWLTVNENDIVVKATEEMMDLLGFNPLDQPLSSIWQPLEDDMVSTVSHTLRICTHMNQNNYKTLICTDITDLKNHMVMNDSNTMITRLTMYGTIEATYALHPNFSEDCVGQPMMRYIHSDDVLLFCAGLNEATKFDTITHFQIRLMTTTNKDEVTPCHFTVMLLQDHRVLCFIQPVKEDIQKTTHPYSLLVKKTATKLQSSFWYALEHGMHLLAKHLALSLIALVQTIWCIYRKDDPYLRSLVQSTKESTEMETLCQWVSYLGIAPSTTKSCLHLTLDHTSEWLISKSSTFQYIYDHIL